MRSRKAVVELARSWIGKRESNGSHKEIIDIYNSHRPLPRNAKMQYNYAWCACTVSALAIKLGYTDIMPVEMSCGFMIEEAKKMDIWVENDGYVPQPGDSVLYDWDDKGVGDNTGWPDHVGIVETVNKDAGYFTVIEGNYQDSVKRRTVSINGKFIRGFITPKYDSVDEPVYIPKDTTMDQNRVAHEVIAGQWGNGAERKEDLEKAGYDYETIRRLVNAILNGDAVLAKDPVQNQDQPVEKCVAATCYANSKDVRLTGTYETTAALYCRNDAGANKKALCLIPKGTKVQCYGYYTEFSGYKWYLINFSMDGVRYTGFSHSNYLRRIS